MLIIIQNFAQILKLKTENLLKVLIVDFFIDDL